MTSLFDAMPMIAEPSDEQRLRRQFIHSWRHRLTDRRALDFTLRFMGSDATRDLAFRWLVKRDGLLARREVSMRDGLAAQRSALRAASLLLERACAVEGLSMAAVAFGVLPEAYHPMPSEGYPWTVFDGVDATLAARSCWIPRAKDGWERRFRAHGAFIRPLCHRSGGWAVRQQDGVLHTSMRVGEHEMASGARGVGLLTLRSVLPETAKAAMVGRAVRDLVDHPVLADPAFVVLDVRESRNGLKVRFTCPTVDVAIADLATSPPRTDQQLGRDGSLAGDEALRDVLGRSDYFGLLGLDPGYFGDAAAYGIFDGVLGERIRKINLMAPPWAERLQIPGR